MGNPEKNPIEIQADNKADDIAWRHLQIDMFSEELSEEDLAVVRSSRTYEELKEKLSPESSQKATILYNHNRTIAMEGVVSGIAIGRSIGFGDKK